MMPPSPTLSGSLISQRKINDSPSFSCTKKFALTLLLALSGVVATMGIYAPLSYLVPDGGTVANVVLLIGLAVGVDYSLFYLKREREERRAGRSTVDAIEIAAATSGHSVVVSGLAVMVAMSGLFVVQDAGFSAIAAGTIIVVAVAVIGSLTVLPAVLSAAAPAFDALVLVKPQFEAGREHVGKGGVVRDQVARRAAVLAVAEAGRRLGAAVLGFAPSGLPGPKGNLETFVWLGEAGRPGALNELEAVVAEVEA